MSEPNWQHIEAENPNLSVDSVDLIGEGWSCLGYLVNGTDVFKIPKLDCWDELNAEILFLERLGEQLPLPVPRPFYHRRRSEATPYGYAAYSYIAGKDLDLNSLTSARRQTAVRDMANFLRALHDLEPVPELREILYVEDHASLAATAERLLAAAEEQIVPRLSLHEADALRREFGQQIRHYDHSFAPCLLHRDFCTDNLRVTDGRISGVIDFGNMVLGDPDIEFDEIYVEHGEATLVETAKIYGHEDPVRLTEKMWRLSIVNAVEVIIDDAEYAPPGVVDQCWATMRQTLQQA